jgi:two-component system sensor histidine kinase HydH
LPESLKLVHKISSGVSHLERLVSQVLQFTRQMTANAVQADAAEVLDHAVELARPHCEALGVTCQAEGPRPMIAHVDPQLLGQAALNLLINAAEACSAGGIIRITWSDSSGRLRVIVADDGPGVPPHLLDKIFNPFFTTKETGTGLGLAIVHRIVEAHDGAISVRNRPGGGAEFDLKL